MDFSEEASQQEVAETNCAVYDVIRESFLHDDNTVSLAAVSELSVKSNTHEEAAEPIPQEVESVFPPEAGKNLPSDSAQVSETCENEFNRSLLESDRLRDEATIPVQETFETTEEPSETTKMAEVTADQAEAPSIANLLRPRKAVRSRTRGFKDAEISGKVQESSQGTEISTDVVEFVQILPEASKNRKRLVSISLAREVVKLGSREEAKLAKRLRSNFLEASLTSYKYHMYHICGTEDFLHDGFYDNGRFGPFKSLETLQNEPVRPNDREVVLMDMYVLSHCTFH